MQGVILRNFQSPGDIVMLTAAVRDLHRSQPGKFGIDVRTPCPQLWENNPFITSIADDANDVEVIDCDYPLVHQSNTGPWHFIHGFIRFLSMRLRVNIEPGAFKGDIHLSLEEKAWISQVQEITRELVPFWIIVAGGKLDFSAKWWPNERYQEVVDHFAGRILFVQVGEAGHHHPPLRGVLDLRGKTDLRQLVRLMHHTQGVLCPVTLVMHLAAAVETRPGMPLNRACVVVAGGREPSQWEAYPHHQYIHTNGALLCCDNGGCWKSRVVPLGDGDEKDCPENLCEDVVNQRTHAWSFRRRHGEQVPSHARAGRTNRRVTDYLPRCLDLITSEEVCRRIELYFNGGALHYLTAEEARIAENAIQKCSLPQSTMDADLVTKET